MFDYLGAILKTKAKIYLSISDFVFQLIKILLGEQFKYFVQKFESSITENAVSLSAMIIKKAEEISVIIENLT